MYSFLVILFVISAYGQIYHGHDLHAMADATFKYLDFDHDGVIAWDEWDSAMTNYYDNNTDNCVSRDEYFVLSEMPHEVTDPIFDHYDNNHDSCWDKSEQRLIYQAMDHIHPNNQVDLHEYETYYQHFYQQVFGHHDNGHHNGR